MERPTKWSDDSRIYEWAETKTDSPVRSDLLQSLRLDGWGKSSSFPHFPASSRGGNRLRPETKPTAPQMWCQIIQIVVRVSFGLQKKTLSLCLFICVTFRIRENEKKKTGLTSSLVHTNSVLFWSFQRANLQCGRFDSSKSKSIPRFRLVLFGAHNLREIPGRAWRTDCFVYFSWKILRKQLKTRRVLLVFLWFSSQMVVSPGTIVLPSAAKKANETPTALLQSSCSRSQLGLKFQRYCSMVSSCIFMFENRNAILSIVTHGHGSKPRCLGKHLG